MNIVTVGSFPLNCLHNQLHGPILVRKAETFANSSSSLWQNHTVHIITRCELISCECMEVSPSLMQGYFPVCMSTEGLGTSQFFEQLSGRLDF